MDTNLSIGQKAEQQFLMLYLQIILFCIPLQFLLQMRLHVLAQLHRQFFMKADILRLMKEIMVAHLLFLLFQHVKQQV